MSPALRIVVALAIASIASRPAGAVETPGVSVIDGAAAPPLVGAAIASVRIYSIRDGEARAIPFQIDERDHRGRWVVDSGPKAGPDDSPGEIDENDALVVANRDLGIRRGREALPPGADRWVEIGVGGAERRIGWLYAGTFAEPPALAADPGYVRMESDGRRFFSPRYAVGFGGPLPDHVAFVDRIGDRGENRLTAVRAVGEARLFGGLVRIRRDESAIGAELEGLRTGPVRAIRRARYHIRLPLGFKARGRVALLFSRDAVTAEAVARIEIPPSLVPGDGELTAAFEFRDLDGARLIVDGIPTDAVVDGSTSMEEAGIDGREGRSAALALANGGAFLLAVDLEGALRRLDQRLRFRESATERPTFGFELSKVSRLETGEHPMSVTGMVLADDEDVAAATRRLLSPLELEVREIVAGNDRAQPTASDPAGSTASSSSANR
jgi:hypothetical protein